MYLFLGVWGQLEVDTDGVPPPSQRPLKSTAHNFIRTQLYAC